MIAVVPANTLDHVVFFADDGTAYTMRMNEMPASSGYGEPITKFFRLADQVKIIAAATTDERFMPAEVPADRRRAAGAVCAGGDGVRPNAADAVGAVPRRFDQGRPALRAAGGGRQGRDGDGAEADEESLFLASANGHVIHFPLSEINILSGVGKGVIGIKLDEGRYVSGRRAGLESARRVGGRDGGRQDRWSFVAASTRRCRAAARVSRR